MSDIMLATCRERIAYWEHVDSVNLARSYLAQHGHRVGQAYTSPTYIRQGRQDLAEAFLASDAEYICYIDSDNVLHPATVYRLLQNDLPIVSALYFKRKGGPEAVAFNWADDNRVATYSESKAISEWLIEHDVQPSTQERCLELDNSLMKVDVVGFGCCLIRRDVMEALSDSHKDLFGNHTHNIGEDVYFCRIAQDAGFPIYVDLNLHIGHIKHYSVSSADFLHVKEWILDNEQS
jgi:glycosyltransferase involved in cell wall biosynthesis